MAYEVACTCCFASKFAVVLRRAIVVSAIAISARFYGLIIHNGRHNIAPAPTGLAI
jgi:hypothetical protein